MSAPDRPEPGTAEAADIPHADIPHADIPRADIEATARAFARCFAGRDGALVLAHLRRLTFERHLGPEASEAALRHLEGQRALVAAIAGLIRRGRQGG